MNEPRFTKGPWRVNDDNDQIGDVWSVPENKPVAMAQITGPVKRREDHSERIANAHLMAAAPDLYEALANIVCQFEEALEMHTPRDREVICQAKAALLKASPEKK